MDGPEVDLTNLTINRHHNLDNLPNDIYDFYLFKYLDLDDIWRLRLVSKALYSIVKSYEISELSFLDRDWLQGGFWFSTNKSTGFLNRTHFFKYHSVLDKPSKNLTNLNRLKIKGRDAFEIDMNDLNKFAKLQVLEIGPLCECSAGHLSLPNLQSLSIELDIYLDSFTDNYYSNRRSGKFIEFKCPSSVKYLKSNHYDKTFTMFNSLECLELFSNSIKGVNNLASHKNLKKLRIIYLTKIDTNALKKLFISKRDDLVIVLEGVKVKETGKFDEFIHSSPLEFQLKNYAELEDKLDHVETIKYGQLISLLPKQPADLFSKYSNIRKILIDESVNDENRLIQFIDHCPNLYNLTIAYSSLSQQFYDQLPTVSLLSYLLIDNFEEILNIQFVMKMPKLIYFYIYRNVQMNPEFDLGHLVYLSKFEIRVDNRSFRLHSKGKDEYYFENRDDGEVLSLRELIELSIDSNCSKSSNLD